MPAPAEPSRDTSFVNPASERSDTDETVTAAGKSNSTAESGFTVPIAEGEVGVLGPYRIVKELGRGGMGAVYAALDTRLDRKLALKVMLPQFAADASAKERFLREARAAAKISHDNVVTVYEADERQGVPYIAMQFLEGYPLDEYLKKRGNPTIPQILRMAMETATGLAAAHKIGLVHRDIKPGNLWLEAPNGRVKVLDFGLAKPVDADVELTKSGAVVGTPAYMSPEQARGEKVDHRTDLFSLGAVLYRLCTGRLPFQGATTMAVLMALGTEEPKPVRELNPNVPESLAVLIHQLLAKRADDRPQSGMEVAKRVRAVAEELAAARTTQPEQSLSTPQLVQPQVVYAVMPVTVVPTGNPFADLDSPRTEPETQAAKAEELPEEEVAEEKPSRKKSSTTKTAIAKPGTEQKSRNGTLWIAAGAVVLAIVAVVGVIISMNKGGQPKPDSPDIAKTEGKDKGKTIPPVGPGKKDPPVVDDSSDRKAAERIFALGGKVRVNGVDDDTPTVGELPKERFTLTGVSLNGITAMSDVDMALLKDIKELKHLYLHNTSVGDTGLTHLKDCRGLVILGLNGTKTTDVGVAHFRECKGLTLLDLGTTRVTDVGLANFKDCNSLGTLHLTGLRSVTDVGLAYFKHCTKLTHLLLGDTGVTDVGLAFVKDCKELKTVELFGTKVTDAGLAHFKECKNLKQLDVRNTKVTAKALEEFRVALPGCRIEHDGGVIEPKVIDYERAAAEWVLKRGGVLYFDSVKGVHSVDRLPQEAFTIRGVFLHDNKIEDDDFLKFKNLQSLTLIRLCRTQVVSDAGLAHLKHLQIAELDVTSTKVTDVGIGHFENLKSLAILRLSGTSVTDKTLMRLKESKSLSILDVRNTKVTLKGVQELHTAVPGCHITHDGGVIEPISAAEIDYKAAKWVIEQGGVVYVPSVKEVSDVANLPKEITLWDVYLTEKVTDDGLAILSGCHRLIKVTFAGKPRVSDVGLSHFRHCTQIMVLSIENSGITDIGLAYFKDCKEMQELNLTNNPRVTDAGIVTLKEFKKLKNLHVKGTGLTLKGAQELHAAVPGCRIEHDGGVIEPKK